MRPPEPLDRDEDAPRIDFDAAMRAIFTMPPPPLPWELTRPLPSEKDRPE